MKVYHGSAILRNDGLDASTGKADLNAGVGVQVTIRINSTQALASIFDLNEVAIANPLTTNNNGNYAFKSADNIYDIIISEGTANEEKLEKVEIVEIPTAQILINDLSQTYEFDSVDDMTSSLIVFPLGKRLSTGGTKWEVTSTLTTITLTTGLYAKSTGEVFLGDFVSGQANEHANIILWLGVGGELNLDKDAAVTQNIDVTANDLKINGTGTITFSAAVGGTNAFRIGGNGNKWKGGHVKHSGQHTSVSRLVWFEGDNNRAENIEGTFLTPITPVDGEQYSGTAFTMTGDSSTVKGCYGEDVGSGVECNGRNNCQFGNNFTRWCRLVINNVASRNHIVDGNYGDAEGKGAGLQGCDGILDNRSARFGRFTNNHIKGSGEHGAYMQGDGFVLDKTNYFEDTHACMIKVGSKPTGNFTHPGETLPTFNQFGQPDPSGVYACTGAVIEPRGKNCNTSGTSDGVVCLQTNIADIQVNNYDIQDCPNPVNSLRSLYLESEPLAARTVMTNIKIGAGVIMRSGDVLLACEVGLYVGNIKTDGVISTFSSNVSLSNAGPVFEIESAKGIELNRAQDSLVKGGTVRYVAKGTGLRTKIKGVKITDQSSTNGGDFSGARVKEISRCDITWTDAAVAMSVDEVQIFRANAVDITVFSGDYPVQHGFNSTFVQKGQFSDNTIIALLSARPVRVGGSVNTVTSNTVINDGSVNRVITIQSVDTTVLGNTVGDGTVYLDTASNGCFVVQGLVTDVGTGNVVIST